MRKKYIYKDIWKYITYKRIIVFIVWLAIFIPAYGWLLNHPECSTLIISNMKEVNGTFFYLDNSSGIPQLVSPPCAWYIWHPIDIARPYLIAGVIIASITLYIIYKKEIHNFFDKVKIE
jgi:hypothetical protein